LGQGEEKKRRRLIGCPGELVQRRVDVVSVDGWPIRIQTATNAQINERIRRIDFL
jgi:hypothetical protein